MSVDIFLSSTLDNNNNNNIIRQPHKSHQNYPEQEQLQQQPPLLTSVSDETKELSNNDTTMTEHEGMSASEDNDNKSAKRKIIASAAATTTTIRFKAETNGLIEKEKLKIRDTFLKQGQSIRAIGKAIEKDGIVVNKSKICTTIKHILKEEIKNGIITRRSIERHCLAEWKYKTKPKVRSMAATSVVATAVTKTIDENDNLSFSPSGGITHAAATIGKDRQQEQQQSATTAAIPIDGISSTKDTLDITNRVSLVKTNSISMDHVERETISSSRNNGNNDIVAKGLLLALDKSQFPFLKKGMQTCFKRIFFKVAKKNNEYHLEFDSVDTDTQKRIDPVKIMPSLDKYLLEDPVKNSFNP